MAFLWLFFSVRYLLSETELANLHVCAVRNNASSVFEHSIVDTDMAHLVHTGAQRKDRVPTEDMDVRLDAAMVRTSLERTNGTEPGKERDVPQPYQEQCFQASASARSALMVVGTTWRQPVGRVTNVRRCEVLWYKEWKGE